MVNKLILVLWFFTCFSSVASANSKKIKDPTSELSSKTVSVVIGKKSKVQKIYCLKQNAGELTGKKGNYLFTSFSELLKIFKKNKPATSRLQLVTALNKVGKDACATSLPAGDFLSLEPYNGSFGEDEAGILYDRFAFGAPPSTINSAIKNGLEKTVQQLLTFQPDTYSDQIENDYKCDGYPAGNENDRPCDLNNPNDISSYGMRYAIYARMWYGQNPFFDKFFFFLHDERLAVSSSVLNWSELNALPKYIDLVRKAARSGDYKQYMTDWNNDFLGHLKWLDGGSNSGFSPNENYAREFWELGTVGASGLDGKPIYTDADISNSALAFSGWTIGAYEFNENWVSFGAYAPALHALGLKTIFAQTPYETKVDNAADVLEATFKHPATAENLAKDLWKEFINPYADSGAIKNLAKLIRENNYNLLPVFRTMMRSKALYAGKSRRTLIKHPVDLVFGFLRQTKMPTEYWLIDWSLEKMGEQPLLAPTVFGWNEEKLASEALILDWRNSILRLTTTDNEFWKTKGFICNEEFFAGLNSSTAPSRALVDSFVKRLNIKVNPQQVNKLIEYLDYDYQTCENPDWCDGKSVRINRRVFDPDPQSEESQGGCYKARGLLTILATLPDYRIK
jgi:hypothetical protein